MIAARQSRGPKEAVLLMSYGTLETFPKNSVFDTKVLSQAADELQQPHNFRKVRHVEKTHTHRGHLWQVLVDYLIVCGLACRVQSSPGDNSNGRRNCQSFATAGEGP